MTLANPNFKRFTAVAEDIKKHRRSSVGNEPLALTEIYEDEVNIALWQRDLTSTMQSSVADFLEQNPEFQISMIVTPDNALSSLSGELDKADQSELVENVAELVDMFCSLFGLEQVGLRMTALDKAMCPKFHVDKVPCRLVTTYQGVATEWLEHQVVDRSKLGRGSKGLADSESGIYQQLSDIQQLQAGDVALLKGESWIGNENAGLVHRSPAVANGGRRLLLTLDFA